MKQTKVTPKQYSAVRVIVDGLSAGVVLMAKAKLLQLLMRGEDITITAQSITWRVK